MHVLEVGQVWAYRTRPGDQGSTLTIGRLEESAVAGRVVHISVSDVHIKNPRIAGGYSTQLPHAPFSETAIEQSVTELVGKASPPPDFEAGYQQWQQARGGVFTISVAEAVDFVEQRLNR